VGIVLITGVGGFVGSHVLERILTHTDHDVIGVDSWRHNGVPTHLSTILNTTQRANRVTVITHDLTAPFDLRQRRQLWEVTHVINVASRCSVDESLVDPASFVRNNIDLMLEILEWARRPRRHQLELFIHMSTDEVLGADRLMEPHWHRPSSPYAASKAAQEDLCRAYSATYDLPIKIVTSANMFGERQSHLAFIPQIVRALVNNRVISVHTARDGTMGSRHYSYVRNVADRIVALLDVDVRPGRMVLAGQENIGNRDLVERIARIVGVEARIREVPGDRIRPGYDSQYPQLPTFGVHWADAAKLTPVDEALANTVAWAVDNERAGSL